MKFTEAQLEKAIIELLGEEGFPHVCGENIQRASVSEVLIKDDLRTFLRNHYKEDGITSAEIDAVVNQLDAYTTAELYESNKAIMKLVSDGFLLKREDHTQKDLYIQLINYSNLIAFREPEPGEVPTIGVKESATYRASSNIFKMVNQLEIYGDEKRIPDGILYINGLPLVVFEFKSAIREETTIHDAYVQLTVRYRRDIPELFKYNAFCVISDGVNNKAGSFFAPYEFYYAWGRCWENGAPAPFECNTRNEGSRSYPSPSGIDSLYSMIKGLFNQTTLCDVIRNFVYLPDTSRSEEKILCRYPQYYAATKLYQNILWHMTPEGDGKGGTYFGATGCGKSYTMLFLTRLLMKSVALYSPTIILITDRSDLDAQLAGLFTNGKGFIGDESIISVENRSQLRDLLKGHNSGGVFLTTIHKFTEDTKLLTNRNNVICISDEAHRSQVNLDQSIKVTSDGVRRTFGFAKYLHDSLPNATYVGFTGTPIDATLDVFGEVVDAYTMTESVTDEITVPIVYEGRAAKVILDNSKLQDIEKYYSECADEGTNEYAIEKSKNSNLKMTAILGDPDRLKALAKDFVAHYEARINEGATVAGKAMFVSSSRPIAYGFYKEVVALLGERSSRCVISKNHNYAKDFTTLFGMPEEWHKQNLPHRDKKGLIQSITFRLADSLPQYLLKEIAAKLAKLSDEEKQLELNKQYQHQLDQGYGCCALAHPDMANMMFAALKYHDGEKYDLLAWSIMPNHVHVLIRTNDKLPDIVQSWKSFTGKVALKNRSKFGIPTEAKKFWQSEYWDRFIRNEEHFNNAVRYIIHNPSQASLDNKSTSYIFTGHGLADRTKRKLHPSQIKMVMTRDKDDEKALYDMLGSKDDRKELDRQFKTAKSNFKIAIVVDMWLTGFDVPFLDTMYIDKPVKRHNLIQTISRVNRKYKQKEKGLVVDYIGIKKQMNMALAYYSKSDTANFEEIKQSIVVVRDHLDLMRAIFHKFDSSPYFSGEPIAQLNCLNMASEYVQITADLEKRFMFLAKRMKSAYDICVGCDEFTQKERDHVHFYMAIRSIVFKLTKGNAPDLAQMNSKVQKMIAEALRSDGVEEIFKMGQGDTSEIDIFDPDYMAKIEKIKLPNTKIKLLQQLLARAIDNFKKVNKLKGVDFSKQFKALVEKYNDRSEQDILRSEVLEDFTDEIINLYHAIKKEKDSFADLGIDFEEKAFYDILKSIAIKYDFEYPEDKLLMLAREVKKVVDDKAKYTDWNQRVDIKAELKVDLIMLLAKHGYPPITHDEVYKEIFEQAENFKKYQKEKII